jgi:hypothetical protein
MADTRYGYIDAVTKRTLLNRAIAYMNSYRDFTEDIFPAIKVPSSKFQWLKFGKEALELRDTARAIYSDAEEVNLSASFNEGQTQSHSITIPVDMQELRNAYDGYNVYADKQEMALSIIMRGKMKTISDVATDTTNSYLSGNTVNIDGTTRKKWDVDGSDPLKDIMDLKQLVEDSCGFEPNRLIIGKTYWRALMGHADLISMLPTTSISKLTRNNASSLFEVEKVVIPTLNYYDSGDGEFVSMFDDILIWAYVDNRNMYPAWGNTFIRQEPETYQEERSRYITRVGADIEYSVIVRSKGSAGYINNALTT